MLQNFKKNRDPSWEIRDDVEDERELNCHEVLLAWERFEGYRATLVSD